ncbi:MAG: hypothetical protein HQL90_11630 [Magnetococcales bacterium]|nr:hypothetical protein [Magnetococcales bacterium]
MTGILIEHPEAPTSNRIEADAALVNPKKRSITILPLLRHSIFFRQHPK